MIRVLQLPGAIERRNGRMSVIMNVYRKIDRSKIQFDFACTDFGFDNYLEEIKQLGGNVYFVKKETIQNIRQLVNILLETGKYSYLQYHAISKWGCCLSIAHKYNVKIIVESHSADLSDTWLKSIRNRIFSLNIIRDADYRVAISQKAGKKLFMWQSFTVVPNMVNYSKFQFNDKTRTRIREKLGIRSRDCLIGCVGRIAKVKNQEYSLELLRQLPANYKIVFVGSGAFKGKRFDYLNRIISDYRLKDRVVFTGEVKNVSDYYSAFDVFWLPSLFEGLPTVVLEALSNGLLCIISDKITREIGISNYVKFLPITPGAEKQWIDETENYSFKRNNKPLTDINHSIFNISDVINNWMKIYDVEGG